MEPTMTHQMLFRQASCQTRTSGKPASWPSFLGLCWAKYDAINTPVIHVLANRASPMVSPSQIRSCRGHHVTKNLRIPGDRRLPKAERYNRNRSSGVSCGERHQIDARHGIRIPIGLALQCFKVDGVNRLLNDLCETSRKMTPRLFLSFPVQNPLLKGRSVSMQHCKADGGGGQHDFIVVLSVQIN
jgi:hypothetical protein